MLSATCSFAAIVSLLFCATLVFSVPVVRENVIPIQDIDLKTAVNGSDEMYLIQTDTDNLLDNTDIEVNTISALDDSRTVLYTVDKIVENIRKEPQTLDTNTFSNGHHSDTTTAAQHFDQTQIDNSIITNPTTPPLETLSTQNTSVFQGQPRHVDTPNQIKMQVVLDYPQSQHQTEAPVKKKKPPKTSKAPETTTPMPVTTSVPTTTTPHRTPKRREAPRVGIFESIAEYLQDVFAPADDDEYETEEVVVANPTQPQKAVTEIYHFYNYSTAPPASTTRFKRADPIVSPPTIIYAMPPPYAGYPPYAYADPRPDLIQTIYRTKRTTLTPGGYQSYAEQGPAYNQPHLITTNADGTKKKNYMSTQIHVTSEYNPGPTMSLEEAALAAAIKKKGSSEESSEEEFSMYDGFSYDDDDGDDDDEDDDDDDKDNASSGEDDDDDEDEDRDEFDDLNDDFESAVGEDDDYSAPIHKQKRKRPTPSHLSNADIMYHDSIHDYPMPASNHINKRTKKMKRTRRPVIKNDYSDEDYSDENRDSDEHRDGRQEPIGEKEAPGFFDNMFGDFFAPISWIWPSTSWSPLRMFSSQPAVVEQTNRRKSRGSTTPRIDVIDSKNPSNSIIFSDFSSNDLDGENQNVWPNLFGASVLTEGTTTVPPVTTAASGFWGWFGSGEKEGEEAMSTEATTEATESGWNLFGIFQDTTIAPPVTTTTRRPFISVSNPLQNPQAWLGILASHLAATRQPASATVTVKKKSYTDHQLWRLQPRTEEQLSFLTEYRSTSDGAALQWWRGPTLRGPTDIVVPPHLVADVKEALADEEITHDVVMWNLGQAVLHENPEMTRREKIELVNEQGHPMSWYRYHRYADITRYLEHLQRKHPEAVELIHIGRSFEGRPLVMAKVSTNKETRSKKKRSHAKKRKREKRSAVFIESGSHAREWIGPATATWILDRLVHHMRVNDSLGESIRSVDWYVLPVLNPDGYEYSHVNDRFWRKTRSKHPDANGSMFSIAMNWIRRKPKDEAADCYGTDANRNWAHLWGEDGSSSSECSEFYAGPTPFSEPETKAVSSFLMDNHKRIKLFVSLHAYGQMISHPGSDNSSYTSSARPADDLNAMAEVAIESLRASGSSTRYSLDAANEMLYARASGAADTFAMNEASIPYAFTLDLRDTGTHGFLLPASNIEAAARDAFEIVRGMVDYM